MTFVGAIAGRASAVLGLAGRLAGPLLEKELRVSSRRRRTYVLRVAYLAALTALVAWFWSDAVGGDPRESLFNQARMAEAGRRVTAALLLFQFCALPLVAAVVLSGSVEEEVRRRTLATLMVTPVGDFRLALGKMLSALVQVGLFAAVSLPVLAVVRVFGGVEWGLVVAGLALVLAMSILAGSVAMLVSTFIRQVYVAVPATLAVLVGLHAGHEWGFGVLAAANPAGLPGVAAEAAVYVLWPANPVRLADAVLGSLVTGTRPGWVGWLWLVTCGWSAGLSALALAACGRRMRRVGLRLATGELRPQDRWGAVMRPGRRRARARGGDGALRRVRGSPVFWRERQVRFGPARLAGLGICALLGSLVATLDLVLLAEGPAYLGAEMFAALAGVLMTVMVVVAAVQGGPAIAPEREAGTLGLLLATPMGRGRIVAEKALGASRLSWPFLGLVMAHALLPVVFGSAHPLVVVHTALNAGGIVVLLTGTGVWWSTVCRRPASAVLLNMGVAAAVLAGPLVAVRLMAGWDLRLAGWEWLHPVVQAVVVSRGAWGDGWRDWLGGGGAAATYDWGWPVGSLGWVSTTLRVGATAVVYAHVGVAFGALAARRLRRLGA